MLRCSATWRYVTYPHRWAKGRVGVSAGRQETTPQPRARSGGTTAIPKAVKPCVSNGHCPEATLRVKQTLSRVMKQVKDKAGRQGRKARPAGRNRVNNEKPFRDRKTDDAAECRSPRIEPSQMAKLPALATKRTLCP